jgi:hypothetical protein
MAPTPTKITLPEAATLSQAVNRSVLTAAVNALDLVPQPAVVLDRLGFVLDANAAADQVFDSEIRVSNRRLVAADRWASAALEHLADALQAAGDATPLPADQIVVRRRMKPSVLISVLPIVPGARNPFLGARALLMPLDLSEQRSLPSRLLATSFGLTAAVPAQCRQKRLLQRRIGRSARDEETGGTRSGCATGRG